MKYRNLVFSTLLILISANTFGQKKNDHIKIGHVFYISLPEYMNRTVGINDFASVEFEDSIKDIGGFIVVDKKEDILLAKKYYSSIEQFFNNYIHTFSIRKIEEVFNKTTKKINGKNFIECDMSYTDEASGIDIYYFLAVVETDCCYYKFLCYSKLENSEEYKPVFQNILFSIKE